MKKIKKCKLLVMTQISHGDEKYSIVTIVNNTINNTVW